MTKSSHSGQTDAGVVRGEGQHEHHNSGEFVTFWVIEASYVAETIAKAMPPHYKSLQSNTQINDKKHEGIEEIEGNETERRLYKIFIQLIVTITCALICTLAICGIGVLDNLSDTWANVKGMAGHIALPMIKAARVMAIPWQ